MKLHSKTAIILLLSWFAITPAMAEEIGAWSLHASQTEEGQPAFTASLTSTTLIASSPDYAPIYAISCRVGDAKRWSQSLQLQDQVAGSGKIAIDATVDGKTAREEIWQIGKGNKTLSRINAPDIAELRTAKRLKLEWNWGWSWLWLAEEARFELGDMEAVIFTLAKNCGIEEP